MLVVFLSLSSGERAIQHAASVLEVLKNRCSNISWVKVPTATPFHLVGAVRMYFVYVK